ncbi:MAG TPA: hypothetical protein VM890_00120 [Longimicrobium sp.]|nr:hypothetical protein [Longimicrobium sp.]
MRKLKLDMNALRVESFDAHPGDRRTTGTVRGNDATPACTPDCSVETGPCFTCNYEDTCGACADTMTPRTCESEYGGC